MKLSSFFCSSVLLVSCGVVSDGKSSTTPIKMSELVTGISKPNTDLNKIIIQSNTDIDTKTNPVVKEKTEPERDAKVVMKESDQN